MPSPSRKALQCNLSYVLREPSKSRAVRRMAREAARFGRQRAGYLGAFEQLSAEDIRRRSAVAPGLLDHVDTGDGTVHVISANIGLPALLPRIASASTGRPIEVSVTLIDDEPGESEYESMDFFGASATMPQIMVTVPHVLVCGAMVRPGGNSLLVCGRLVTRSENTSEAGFRNSVLRALEDLIRDHCDQWSPRRSLWSNPAEITISGISSRLSENRAN